MLHGQTKYDADGRLHGKSDPHLSDKGKGQVQEIVETVKSKGIDMILSAPHKCTMETSWIIAEYLDLDESKIVKGMRIYEREFGDYEGALISEIDVNLFTSWSANTPTPNGETIRETAARVIPYINNMVKLLFKGKTVLIIANRHVLKVLFWYFTGLPEAGKETVAETEHCVIYEFDTENIPPEMMDSQSVLSRINPSGKPGKRNKDRILTQPEIDDIVEEIEKPRNRRSVASNK